MTTTVDRRCLRRLVVTALAAVVWAALAAAPAPAQTRASYANPLQAAIPGDGVVESCADPSVIRGQGSLSRFWYAYCTTDPLNGQDRGSGGGFNFHLVPILRSTDLVSWTYVGDAFVTRPPWVADHAGLWAPDIAYFDGRYHLYFTAPDTKMGGSAIGVATSASPTGPFVDAGTPAVEPHPAPCCPGSRRWTFDPDVLEANGQKYIFYGSYFGGISARRLSEDGLRSDPATQTEIAIANRYEGGHVYKRGQFYYLFASATDCCRGPLTGYSVFAGRSQSPLGPYVDRDGVSLLAGRVGGTPVISMNGNRWVGPGHNFVFADAIGQTWTYYHAIDRHDPYFTGAVGFTKRPLMLDQLDWADGWPTVRGGNWASDTTQSGPALTSGTRPLPVQPLVEPALGPADVAFSDEFDGAALGPQWTWVRPPATETYAVGGGELRFDTQAADLHESSNNASVLTRPAPEYDYAVETRVRLDVPAEGCCFNWTQAGLVTYGNDDNYTKLVHVSIWETRQTEFAKEVGPVAPGFPRYGNTVVSAPDVWTYLRIARTRGGAEERFTAYTSRDGVRWTRGGTWTHTLGAAKIGLVSMGGSGFRATFDYVRVYPLQ
ncbi:MAG: family 43 glycosylhydrolase [Actinomycetota bacterium]|nr:family 43 glycosylhydrolase [Actinomycetota bacterium]